MISHSPHQEKAECPTVFVEDTLREGKNTVNSVLERIMSEGGAKSFSKIVVKPNLMDPMHIPGVTISPRVLEIVASRLRDRYEDVKIVEAGGYNFVAERSFCGHNVRGICKRTGADVFDLCELKKRRLEVRTKWGGAITFPFPEILLDEDTCVISLACMKTHVFTDVSLSIKNLWGCIPDRKRTLLHPYISEILAKIVSSIPYSIGLIDGSVALDGRGPRMGTPFSANLVVGSSNLLAADATAARIMGIEPESVDHLRAVLKTSNKLTSFEEIEVDKKTILELDRRMKATRTWFDALAIAIYWSPATCNLVYNSRLTSYIEFAVRRSGLSPGVSNY